jgi:hypothetical protein
MELKLNSGFFPNSSPRTTGRSTYRFLENKPTFPGFFFQPVVRMTGLSRRRIWKKSRLFPDFFSTSNDHAAAGIFGHSIQSLYVNSSSFQHFSPVEWVEKEPGKSQLFPGFLFTGLGPTEQPQNHLSYLRSTSATSISS